MRAAWRGVVSAGGAHPHRPLRGTAGGPPGSWDKLVPAHPKALPCPMLIEPAAWEQPDMRAALAARDVGTVYRLLRQVGVSQRQIAALTGQSQSEVSEIIKGRQVIAYDVLVRLAVGLGIPREYMEPYQKLGPPPASLQVTHTVARVSDKAHGTIDCV